MTVSTIVAGIQSNGVPLLSHGKDDRYRPNRPRSAPRPEKVGHSPADFIGGFVL